MGKYFTEIEVILYVYGDVFNPSDLTEYIQIIPTQCWCKGDIIPKHGKLTIPPDAVPRVRKESSWNYSTGSIKTLDAYEVSNIFVEKFWSKLPKLVDYMEQKGLEADIYFVVKIADKRTPGLGCNLKLIEMAHQLKARIGVDMYVL